MLKQLIVVVLLLLFFLQFVLICDSSWNFYLTIGFKTVYFEIENVAFVYL